MKATTKEWLDFAKADILICERIIDDDFLTNILAFHSQQAVEKCFKALIEENDIVIPRIHSLLRLYKIVENYLPEPINKHELLSLDDIYTLTRYPSDLGLMPSGKPTQNEAEELFESAKKIYETIIENIK
jgi:HEPN domain-containing protein